MYVVAGYSTDADQAAFCDAATRVTRYLIHFLKLISGVEWSGGQTKHV